jgi:hypothetical protein
MVEISQYLIKPISECFLGEKLGDIGIIANWIEFAVTIFSGKLDSQVLCYSMDIFLFRIIRRSDVISSGINLAK